jgi:hypothetical protein
MRASGVERPFIYHSPQYPGFTSWCGLWNMPDGSVMFCFTQATGPVLGRPRAPQQVRRNLDWPPPGHSEAYDMTGLCLRNLHLRSSDGGYTWQTVSADAFASCMNGVTGEAEAALADGSILRAVWGQYLPYDNLPRTGLLQRSSDGSRTWSAAEVIYRDETQVFWPTRLRVLRDGRVVVSGGLSPASPDGRLRGTGQVISQVLLASEDQGLTWNGPIHVVPETQRGELSGEEFDFSELTSGDLLVVSRAATVRPRQPQDAGEHLWQTRLVKAGATWQPTAMVPAPFPHSGHPELLGTREGLILHLATSGVSWTTDEGASWGELGLGDGLQELGWCLPGTHYYPRAVQMYNGEVLCVGHVGGDNGYGTVDQAIIGLRFSLTGGMSAHVASPSGEMRGASW